MKFIIFGDVVGKIGRKAVAAALADWKTKHAPDLVIANNENLAHGHGVTEKTAEELFRAGVDVTTGGDHTVTSATGLALLADPRYRDRVLRPANYFGDYPGAGVAVITLGQTRVAVINLQGRLFMKTQANDPFAAFDRILTELAARNSQPVTHILVDFHGEATSERAAFGWYVDGRATAIWGTHTHVPTADDRILPGGTAFQTDVGLTGFCDGVIGFTKEDGIRRLTTGEKGPSDIPEHGPAVANALLVEADDQGHAIRVQRLQKFIDI